MKKQFSYAFIILTLLLAGCSAMDTIKDRSSTASSEASSVPEISVAEDVMDQDTGSTKESDLSLYRISPEDLHMYETANMTPSLEEYADYLKRATLSHQAEIVGDIELWQLDEKRESWQTDQRDFQFVAYPVSCDGETTYWGVDRSSGRIYQWTESDSPDQLYKLESIRPADVFGDWLDVLGYVRQNYQALLPIEPYHGGFEFGGHSRIQVRKNDNEGLMQFSYSYDGDFLIATDNITGEAGGSAGDTIYCRISAGGFLRNESNMDIRIVSPEEARTARPSVLDPHMQTLWAMLQSIIDSQENIYEIIDVAYADFDGNGSYEMFARVATNEGADFYLVSDSGTALIKSMEQGLDWSFGPIITIGTKQFIAHRTSGTSGWREYLYGVRGGVAYQTNLCDYGGMLMRGNEYGELLIADSNYDASIGGAGHTWKPYYFYLDGDEFREYGGIPITLEQIRALDQTVDIPEEYRDENMTSAYYRDNGIININYTTEGANWYLTYRSKDGRLYLEDDGEEGYGVYQAAFHEDIATYPKSLPTAIESEASTQKPNSAISGATNVEGQMELIKSGDFSNLTDLSDYEGEWLKRMYDGRETSEWVECDLNENGLRGLIWREKNGRTVGANRVDAVFGVKEDEARLIWWDGLGSRDMHHILSKNGNLIHAYIFYGTATHSNYTRYIFNDDWSYERPYRLTAIRTYDWAIEELKEDGQYDDRVKEQPYWAKSGIYFFSYTDGVEEILDEQQFLKAFEEMTGYSFYGDNPMKPDSVN